MPGKSKTYNFTDRKRSFGNYWRVYSNKVGLILKLISDREVAHWLLNLEFNPNVRSFRFDDFNCDPIANETLSKVKYRVLVTLSSGLEYHCITVSKSRNAENNEKLFDAELWQTKKIRFRHITDIDLTSRKRQIFPLLKLSAFLTSNKDQYLPPGVIEAVDTYLKQMRRGSIAKYLSDLPDFGRQVLMLQLFRLYNSGAIAMGFEETPFKLTTTWELNHG